MERRDGMWPSPFESLFSTGAAMPDTSTWTDDLSPEQRVRNLAAILAEGVRRYGKLALRSDSGEPNKTAESGGMRHWTSWQLRPRNWEWATKLRSVTEDGDVHCTL